MQPGQAVRAGDGDDRTVAEVDERGARLEGALLGVGVAVVPGRTGVRAGLDRDGGRADAGHARGPERVGAAAAHWAQRPVIAMCSTSVVNA